MATVITRLELYESILHSGEKMRSTNLSLDKASKRTGTAKLPTTPKNT